jgi:hypothetical protein
MMSRFNERLTTAANLAVIAGIVFLAAEVRQNTKAIRAQTRDAITEKQMEYYGWVATNPELARVFTKGNRLGRSELDGESGEVMMYLYAVHGILREYENSYYQYQQGLFSDEEFEVRLERWRVGMATKGWRDVWAGGRLGYSPDFRAEIDRIVLETEISEGS